MNRFALLCSILSMAVTGHAAAQADGTIFYLYNPGLRDWVFDLHTIEADGGNESHLTSGFPIHPPKFFNISWSPDGTRITFNHRDPSTNRLDIFVSNSDWTNPINLTNDREMDQSPSWSPDGDHIAFASLRGGLADIFVMNADGSNLTQLTDNSVIESYPAWSPDGSKIAFVSHRDDSGELYIMNADGTNPVRLTDSPEDEKSPLWSPDGTQIAYSVMSVGTNRPQQIRAITVDGTNLVHLTDNNSGWKDTPTWSPDGTQIAFTGEREDGSGTDIFIMNADGTDLFQLTHSEGRALGQFPSWLPVAGSSTTLIEAISWGTIKANLR